MRILNHEIQMQEMQGIQEIQEIQETQLKLMTSHKRRGHEVWNSVVIIFSALNISQACIGLTFEHSLHLSRWLLSLPERLGVGWTFHAKSKFIVPAIH